MAARTIASSSATAVASDSSVPISHAVRSGDVMRTTSSALSIVITSAAFTAVRCTRMPRGPLHAESGPTTTSTGSTPAANGASNQAAADLPPSTASAGMTSMAPRAYKRWSAGRPGSAYTFWKRRRYNPDCSCARVSAPAATACEPRKTPLSP